MGQTLAAFSIVNKAMVVIHAVSAAHIIPGGEDDANVFIVFTDDFIIGAHCHIGGVRALGQFLSFGNHGQNVIINALGSLSFFQGEDGIGDLVFVTAFLHFGNSSEGCSAYG